jgi:hypothetical protein
MPAGVDPLGPDNIFGFSTGPLTGTPAPTGTRWGVFGKSPLTGGWGDANGSGNVGVAVKMSGFDMIFFTGIAPDAEVLPGYFSADNPISSLIPWARSRGADVMLYEFGGFLWDFLDGSSLDEELIAIENGTILQVTPSGNLGRGRKHAIATVAAHDSVTLPVSAVVYGAAPTELYATTLWRTGPGDLPRRRRQARRPARRPAEKLAGNAQVRRPQSHFDRVDAAADGRLEPGRELD